MARREQSIAAAFVNFLGHGPLRHPVFRALSFTTLISNIGSWMQDTAGVWLMTSLAPSPMMVAMVQVMTSLPMFLLAVPAGALADLLDRRRLLLWAQGVQFAAAAALGSLVLLQAVSPWLLLSLLFSMRVGVSLNGPARQSLTSDLVEGTEIQAAIRLSSALVNVARALGPVLGGIVMAVAGHAMPFFLNAVSFIGVVAVLYRWKPAPRQSALPAEHFGGAMRSGIRYVRYAPAMRAVLARSGAFIVVGSAFWALLPLLVKTTLQLGPMGYGLLMGCFGLGAISGVGLLPCLYRYLTVEQITTGALVLFAVMLIGLSVVEHVPTFAGVLVLGGLAWLTLLSTFNASAQAATPAWVRGRALAVYQLVFFGGMTGGSALWGAIAHGIGLPSTLMLAGFVLVVVSLLTGRYPLDPGEGYDVAPSLHWLTPATAHVPSFERGPVFVTVEYRIDSRQAPAFLQAMHDLGAERRRNGAMRWDVCSDVMDAGRYLEVFVLASWGDHIREQERLTARDWALEEQVLTFHQGDAPPRRSYLIAERPPILR